MNRLNLVGSHDTEAQIIPSFNSVASRCGLADIAVEQLVLNLNENDVSCQSLSTSRIEKQICGLSVINLLLVGTATVNPSSYQRDKY